MPALQEWRNFENRREKRPKMLEIEKNRRSLKLQGRPYEKFKFVLGDEKGCEQWLDRLWIKCDEVRRIADGD